MNNVILQRLTLKELSEDGIYGALIYKNKPILVTLELPWKENKRRVSCVPAGIYHTSKMYSHKFKIELFVLHDVPDRDLIELHIGNTLINTEGCILLGKVFNVNGPGILHSKLAFDYFMGLMAEKFTITIKDACNGIDNPNTPSVQKV